MEAMEGVEPRVWLWLAVASLLASLWPYWVWMGMSGLLVNAVLALGAAAGLWASVRGEQRLERARLEREQLQRDATDGAPSSTSAAGTSTEPSSRW
jgi:hypothetical protein